MTLLTVVRHLKADPVFCVRKMTIYFGSVTALFSILHSLLPGQGSFERAEDFHVLLTDTHTHYQAVADSVGTVKGVASCVHAPLTNNTTPTLCVFAAPLLFLLKREEGTLLRYWKEASESR